jgi:hypothetical protein
MGQSPAIALLPSALLGPAVWQPVQAHLQDAGHDAIVVGTPGTSGTSVQDILTWYLDSLPAGREYVLGPHSNAGLYIPAITQQCSVTGLVFVDAILPPREGTVTVAPEGLQKMLRDLADPDGELPVWTSWWPADDVAALFPSEDVRTRVSAEQRRFPLSYFAETVTIGPGWSDLPAAYLGFGDTYEPERAEARSWGWRSETIDGGHLHMLTAPDEVANTIIRLI